MTKEFKIENKMVGENHPCLIIAEISANHNGDFNKAKQLVEAACLSGADVIKVQTYTPDTMTLKSEKEPFQVKVNQAWKGQSLYSLYQKARTPWEWYDELEQIAKQHNVLFIGTPYDSTSIDFLESKNCPFYKIASFEATDINLLKKAAQTKKPVVISRGMTTLDELEQAVNVLKKGSSKDIAILHCVSAYPTEPKDLNLLVIPALKKKFNVVIGLSDHSLTTAPSVASVVLGAKIIERHFILNRADGGPDAAFSLEPSEFVKMVKEIREVEMALGTSVIEPTQGEKENMQFRRSLWVIKDIKKGEVLSKDNVGCFRPEGGLKPEFLEQILGKKVKKDIEFGMPLIWDLIE